MSGYVAFVTRGQEYVFVVLKSIDRQGRRQKFVCVKAVNNIRRFDEDKFTASSLHEPRWYGGNGRCPARLCYFFHSIFILLEKGVIIDNDITMIKHTVLAECVEC